MIVATLARRLQARLVGRPIRTEPSLRGMRTARSVCFSCVTTIWPEAQESVGDERIQRCLTRRAFNAAAALRLRNRQPETRHLKVFCPDPCQQRDWHTNLSVRAPILLKLRDVDLDARTTMSAGAGRASLDMTTCAWAKAHDHASDRPGASYRSSESARAGCARAAP